MFRWDDREFRVGEVIPPARFGQILMGFGPSHKGWSREMVAEFVRMVEFPNRPSRLSGLLTFVDVHAAEENLSTFASRPGIYRLYELAALPKASVFTASEWQLHHVERAMASTRRDLKEATQAARLYWRGGTYQEGLMEGISSMGMLVTAVRGERSLGGTETLGVTET